MPSATLRTSRMISSALVLFFVVGILLIDDAAAQQYVPVAQSNGSSTPRFDAKTSAESNADAWGEAEVSSRSSEIQTRPFSVSSKSRSAESRALTVPPPLFGSDSESDEEAERGAVRRTSYEAPAEQGESTERGGALSASAVRSSPDDAVDSSERRQESNSSASIPISPSRRAAKFFADSKKTDEEKNKPASSMTAVISVASSLGVVLGIFLLMTWLMRRARPQSMAKLPSEAFEVLGRAPLVGRQQAQLLRCGNKLVLISVSPTGVDAIAEIEDPAEVDRISGICRSSHTGSSTAAFKQVFDQLAPKNPSRGMFSRSDFDPLESEQDEYVSYGRGSETHAY